MSVSLFLCFEIALRISALLLKDNTFSVSVSLGYSRVAQPAIWLPTRKMHKSNNLNENLFFIENTFVNSIISKKSSILFSFFPSMVSKPLFKTRRLS